MEISGIGGHEMDVEVKMQILAQIIIGDQEIILILTGRWKFFKPRIINFT